MFCRLSGSRVRVWESYRNPRSSRYGYGSVAELTKVPGIVARACVQNSQKLRAGTKSAVPVPQVLWHGAYRTYRIFGYRYVCPTELTNFSGTGMKVLQNSKKSRVLWHGRT